MAVNSVVEQAVRSGSLTLPDSPRFERKFIVSADPGTDMDEVVVATGVSHWQPHPEYPYTLAKSFSCAPYQSSRRHWEVTVSYETPQKEEQDTSPLSRPDVWSFSVGGAQVPALTCYMGSGNANRKPLTNTAGDFFEGLTTLEAEVRASIQANRASFPMSTAVSYANSVNDSAYLGGAKHTWFCAGISAQRAVEVVNDAELRYWQISTELVYRASGHNLLLPNVGYNFVKSGKKLPCWVWATDAEGNPTSKRVRASTPQKLTQGGDIDPSIPGDETLRGPIILERRVYREMPFASAFGTPTFG
jgi:hypothetical protein